MGPLQAKSLLRTQATDSTIPHDGANVVWHPRLSVYHSSVERLSSYLVFLTFPFLGTRHACDQGDGLDSYTWTEYDTREGGVQVIQDSQNNVRITTEFLKVAGGEHGGSWAARVKGEPIKPGE